MRHISTALFFCLLLPSLAFANPPAADADMQRLLQTWSSLQGRPLVGLKAPQARAQPTLLDAVPFLLKKMGRSTRPEAVFEVKDRTVPGADGEIPARVYTPKGDGPFPVLVYFHGGGWVLGGIDEYDRSARALSNAAACVVVSVGYRQAPEHRYPAAFKDAFAAYNYVRKNADEFYGDERRIAVGGEGSGANLAAAVCLMALESRQRTLPVHQLLICPITNYAFDTQSYRLNAQAKPVGRAEMQWFFSQYLRNSLDGKSPYVSVSRKSVSDLPPATVIVAQLDPLYTEGRAYHEHLLANAVDSQLGAYTGVTADFFGTGQVVLKGKKAVKFAAGRLKKAFITRSPRSTPRRRRPKDKTIPGTTPVQVTPAAPAPAVPAAAPAPASPQR